MSNQLKDKLFRTLAESPTMMVSLTKNVDHSEPMHVCLDKNNHDSLWIFTTKDNRIAGGGMAMAQFVSSDHKLFACSSGKLVQETDRAVVKNHFSTKISSWYSDGLADKNLEVLRFDIQSTEIWEKDASAMAKLKMAFGAKVDPESLGNRELV